MSIGTNWQQGINYWDDRTDLPLLESYDTVEEWQAAMDAWQTTHQGTPAYAGDTTTTYQRDDGSTGEWYTAGMSENNPSFGLSQSVIDANTLNRKFMQYLQNPDGPGPGLGLALSNMMKQRPDMIQNAYQAVGKDGRPVLLPEVISYLERLGIRPSADITQPRPEQQPPGKNQPGGADWSSDRLNVWGQTFIDEINRAVAGGDQVSLFDEFLTDNMQRFLDEGYTYAEFLDHVNAILADNGYKEEDHWITPTGATPAATPSSAGTWSTDRLSTFNNQYLKEATRAIANAGPGGVHFQDTALNDNYARFINAGYTHDEFLNHIRQVMADNGITVDANGFMVMTPPADAATEMSFSGNANSYNGPKPSQLGATGPASGMISDALGGTPADYGILPGENNAGAVQQLQGFVGNSGNGDFPEWMEIAKQNRKSMSMLPKYPTSGILGF